MKDKIRTRFAPSPTGFLHIGGYRTALFNYLFAKQNNGEFVLRIEDTDKERSKKEYEENILEGLDWLNLSYDELVKQSERVEEHKKYLQKLIDNGNAYISKEKSGERSEVIRFRNPNKKVVFTDLIRGEVSFDTTELGDFVIAKSMEEPLFHLAVVADDFDLNITHVIRGEDHISNTPRQILIMEALDFNIPTYAHIPLILASDKSKLSKRKGALPITDYRDQGFLPEAVINYMALLGWNPGDEREIFSLDELIKEFDIKKVQKGGAVFSEEKLRWINKEHLRIKFQENKEEILQEIDSKIRSKFPNGDSLDENLTRNVSGEMASRIEVYSDVAKEIEAGELDYFFQSPKVDKNKLTWKDDTLDKTKEYLKNVIEKLEDIPEDNFSTETIKNALWDFAEEVGKGNVLWPTRFALTGKDKSPDPFTVASILGKKETLKRLRSALML